MQRHLAQLECSIHQLPAELLVYIFNCTNLGDIRTLAALSLVCRQFSAFANSNDVWRRQVFFLYQPKSPKISDDNIFFKQVYKDGISKLVTKFINALNNPKVSIPNKYNYATYDLSLPSYLNVIPSDSNIEEYISAKATELKMILDKAKDPALVIKMFLDQGGDPNTFMKDEQRNDVGPSICYFMVYIGNLNCLKLLLSAGMNPDGNLANYSPLHLIVRGQTFESKSISHFSSFPWRTESDNELKILRCLLQHGAHVARTNIPKLPSPISFAIEYLRANSVHLLHDALQAEFLHQNDYSQPYRISLIQHLKKSYTDLVVNLINKSCEHISDQFNPVITANKTIAINHLILTVSLNDLIEKESGKLELPMLQAILLFKKTLRILLTHNVEISPDEMHEPQSYDRKFKAFLEQIGLLKNTNKLVAEMLDRNTNEDDVLANLKQYYQLKLFEIPARAQTDASRLPKKMFLIPRSKLSLINLFKTYSSIYGEYSLGLISKYMESSILLVRGQPHAAISKEVLFSMLNASKAIPCLIIICNDFNLILNAKDDEMPTSLRKFLFVNHDASFELGNVNSINDYLMEIFKMWRQQQTPYTDENHPSNLLWELGLNRSYHWEVRDNHNVCIDGPPPSDQNNSRTCKRKESPTPDADDQTEQPREEKRYRRN